MYTLLVASSLLFGQVQEQDEPVTPVSPPPVVKVTIPPTAPPTIKSGSIFSEPLQNSWMQLAFGVLVLIGACSVLITQLVLMRKTGHFWSSYSFRMFGTTLIVFTAMFMVSAGYPDNQTMPVYTLLGTVMGYIFGKSDANSPPSEGTLQIVPGVPQEKK